MQCGGHQQQGSDRGRFAGISESHGGLRIGTLFRSARSGITAGGCEIPPAPESNWSVEVTTPESSGITGGDVQYEKIGLLSDALGKRIAIPAFQARVIRIRSSSSVGSGSLPGPERRHACHPSVGSTMVNPSVARVSMFLRVAG